MQCCVLKNNPDPYGRITPRCDSSGHVTAPPCSGGGLWTGPSRTDAFAPGSRVGWVSKLLRRGGEEAQVRPGNVRKTVAGEQGAAAPGPPRESFPTVDLHIT